MRVGAEQRYTSLSTTSPHELLSFLLLPLSVPAHSPFSAVLLRRLITSNPSLVTGNGGSGGEAVLKSCLESFEGSGSYGRRMMAHLMAQALSSLPPAR